MKPALTLPQSAGALHSEHIPIHPPSKRLPKFSIPIFALPLCTWRRALTRHHSLPSPLVVPVIHSHHRQAGITSTKHSTGRDGQSKKALDSAMNEQKHRQPCRELLCNPICTNNITHVTKEGLRTFFYSMALQQGLLVTQP